MYVFEQKKKIKTIWLTISNLSSAMLIDKSNEMLSPFNREQPERCFQVSVSSELLYAKD